MIVQLVGQVRDMYSVSRGCRLVTVLMIHCSSTSLVHVPMNHTVARPLPKPPQLLHECACVYFDVDDTDAHGPFTATELQQAARVIVP